MAQVLQDGGAGVSTRHPGSPSGPLIQSWPRPATTLAACIESAGLWLAILLAGWILLIGVLLSLQRQEAQTLRDARLQPTLQEIRQRLEADLSLGLELADSASAQQLLEDLVARDPTLLAGEVFDVNGISLFNTDRGSIGERVPQIWQDRALAAGRQKTTPAGQSWVATVAGDSTLGLPVRNAFGELSGHVCLTSAAVPRPEPLGFLLLALSGFAGLAGALVFVVWRALRRRQEATSTSSMEAAAMTLAITNTHLQSVLAQLTREEGAAP